MVYYLFLCKFIYFNFSSEESIALYKVGVKFGWAVGWLVGCWLLVAGSWFLVLGCWFRHW